MELGIFIMLQHSRIRAMYQIDGSAADDCCSAYYCPCCTALQDDREIRAREYKDGMNEKRRGAIKVQPLTQPDMQYAAPHLFGGEPVQHRGSLVREESATAATGYRQSSQGRGPKGANQWLEHSQHHHEHKKLHNTPKIEMNEHKINEEGKMAHLNHQLAISSNGRASNNPSTYLDRERDAIIASRQKWRHQDLPESKKNTPSILGQIPQLIMLELVIIVNQPPNAGRYLIILKMRRSVKSEGNEF
jgi:hypothetical protein